MTPIEEIAAERERQKTVEGWTAEHDDEHDDDDLAIAAACYALPDRIRRIVIFDRTLLERIWPWSKDWWKPKRDRRRQLVKAGALIVAEIERLDRAAQQEAA